MNNDQIITLERNQTMPETMKSQQPSNLKARLETNDAFTAAIRQGRLSRDPKADNYAGNYMYMGPCTGGPKKSDGTVDLFKHIDTHQYI